MKFITINYKRMRFTYIKVAIFIAFIAALFLPTYVKWEDEGDNMFHAYVNGEDVGLVADTVSVDRWVWEARKELAASTEGMLFLETSVEYEGLTVLWGQVDDEETVKEHIRKIIREDSSVGQDSAYVVKINNYTVNLATIDEVEQLLQAAVDLYDATGTYRVSLLHEEGREFPVLTAEIMDTADKSNEPAKPVSTEVPMIKGGVDETCAAMFADVEPAIERDLSEYDLGQINMSFVEEIEITEAYLAKDQLTPLGEAIEFVTKEQEIPAVYEVKSGDTLSEISITVNIPMDQIVAMNDSLESINSTLRIGQQLVITVPQPELSIVRQEQIYFEEIYDADVIYIDNDSWYTTKQVTLQAPSAGFRRGVAIVTYTNSSMTGREIIIEDVVKEAVPKIVERGTITPPTYVKPISGGRLSSGFGKRNAPTKGASTYHKGVDWAVPKGTTVTASCGGTVAKAGWGSGYGYVVYINHPDGRQTRYAHLSKILVTVGQKVSQGQAIALSGNSGVSTGPHLHFEILINGSQVNPLKYI